MLWSNLVDVLRGTLFVVAHWCGGSLGAAILVASTTLRVAIVPLTFAAAKRRLARERAVAQLAGEVARIKRAHAGDSRAIGAAIQRLYAAQGISVVDRRTILDSLIQLPLGTAMYAATRASTAARRVGFLWVRDLGSSDRSLAIGAAAVSAIVARITMTHSDAGMAARLTQVMIASAVAFFVLSHMSAGLALCSIANSLVTGMERASVGTGVRRPSA
ncbi:MAG TPA: YidC/Oxa1 family membrane protein insertase [Gemmatimonadaceae bacterium]|nr:YidC/Oxa1 family membrane protein insertase [Gemmatimonadaceae bacterium]